MNCRKCKAVMEKVSFSGVDVMRCTGCKGLWFDRQDSYKLKSIKGSEAIDTGSIEVVKKYDRMTRIARPRCGDDMTSVHDADQPHIGFESCEACNGTFSTQANSATSRKNHSPTSSMTSLPPATAGSL